MATSAYVRYLQPAGTPAPGGGEICPDGTWAASAADCGPYAAAFDQRTPEERAAQRGDARRTEDFRLAGTLTTAIANLVAQLGTGIITADTQRQAQALTAQTNHALANLREQALSTNPYVANQANTSIAALMAENARLQGLAGSGSSMSTNKTLLIVGGVVLAGAAVAGVVMLARQPHRRNPVVGRGRNRHYVKPRAKTAARKRAR